MITDVGTPWQAAQASSNNWAVTLPGALAAGDVIIIPLTMDFSNGPTITPPTGFVDLSGGGSFYNGNGRLFVYRKVATGSEGSSVSFGLSANEYGAKGCLVYRGVDNTTPEDVASSKRNIVGPSTTPSQNSLTTVTNGCMIIGFHSTRTNIANSGTPDSSPAATEMIEMSAGPSTAAFLYGQQYLQPTAGAIALDATMADGGGPWTMVQVALRPAADGEFFTKAVTVSFV